MPGCQRGRGAGTAVYRRTRKRKAGAVPEGRSPGPFPKCLLLPLHFKTDIAALALVLPGPRGRPLAVRRARVFEPKSEQTGSTAQSNAGHGPSALPNAAASRLIRRPAAQYCDKGLVGIVDNPVDHKGGLAQEFNVERMAILLRAGYLRRPYHASEADLIRGPRKPDTAALSAHGAYETGIDQQRQRLGGQ